MKATEARKLTEKNAYTFEQVITVIKKIAKEGKSNCDVFGQVQSNVIEKLKENGFEVKDEYGRGYSIKW